MTTTKAAETFRINTREKDIRLVAPGRWEVRVHAGRNPETGKTRHIDPVVGLLEATGALGPAPNPA